jgi:hypothetical protein
MPREILSPPQQRQVLRRQRDEQQQRLMKEEYERRIERQDRALTHWKGCDLTKELKEE